MLLDVGGCTCVLEDEGGLGVVPWDASDVLASLCDELREGIKKEFRLVSRGESGKREGKW